VKILYGVMNVFFLFTLAISAYAAEISNSQDEEQHISEKLIGYLNANIILVDFSSQTSIQTLQWISNEIKPYPRAILAVKVINVKSQDLKTLLSLLTKAYYLDISDNGLNPQDAQIIAESVHLRKLEKLDISKNKIGSQGAKAIATSKKFWLHQLNLNDNQILIDAMDAIVKSQRLKKLKVLDLSKNTIGNAGAAAIANSVRLKQLKKLNLNETEIGDIGIMEILYKDNLNLCEFRGVEQSEGKITDNVAKMAKIQFRDCGWEKHKSGASTERRL
jgi:hypothetical protein